VKLQTRKKNHYICIYYHGEKSFKYFDQCGSHDDKTFLFYVIGQFIDTITRSWMPCSFRQLW